MRPIPYVIKIATRRLAARDGGLVAVAHKGSVYERLRKRRLLLGVLCDQQPGKPPRISYRPSRYGERMLRHYEATRQVA